MTAAAPDQSVIEGGTITAFSAVKICIHIASSNAFVVLYNKSLND